MSIGPPQARHRWSGLDGLRAFAVVAVVAFHFAPRVLPGGFLGVDVFFVLSGYLITRMIVTEYRQGGRFGFASFYLRRARRLLPGLVVVLVAVLAVSAFWRDQLATVRPASGAAAVYLSNWWLSFAHQSYFVSVGRPSMLQHLWSLAVEEQFYLVWPVVAIAVLTLGRARTDPVRGARTLAVVAVVLALASTAEMTMLAVASHAPYGQDASRLYYGTDTHSMGLLLGAALGALAAGRARPRPGAGPSARHRHLWASDLAAVGALVALVVIVVSVGQFSPALYRGGFLGVAALAGLAAATVTRRGSRVGRALDCPPLQWLAARSYAIYLWHWPVAVVSRPGVDVYWPTPVVQVVRVLVTIGLADATYRFVESPVRTLGLRASARNGARRVTRVVTGQAPVGAHLAAAALVTAVLLAGAVLAVAPPAPRSAAQDSVISAGGGGTVPLHPTAPITPSLSPSSRAAATTPASGVGHSSSRAAAPTSSTPSAGTAAGGPKHRMLGRLPRISAYGDSVMLGARPALEQRFPGGTMDAVEGRQPDPILHDIERDAAAGRLNPVVIIGVGDNGLIDPDSLRHTLSVLAKRPAIRQVIVLNDRVDRPWQDPNNDAIADVVPHFKKARALDWHRASARHGSWFFNDGIHLTPDGAAAYAGLLAATARRMG